MLLCVHLLASKDLLDDAVLVDDESRANGAHRLLSVHRLLAPSTHFFQEFLVHIGYQGERQSVLLLELLVGRGRVFANPNHLIASTLQLAIPVAQTASLSRTATRIVLRIEIEHEFATLVIAQKDVLSVLILAQNLRRFVSNFHNISVLMLIRGQRYNIFPNRQTSDVENPRLPFLYIYNNV